MSLSSKYNPQAVEDKWYQQWMNKNFFHSSPNPDKEPYTIVIPPPNVTGVLHMGHMLNNTIQDVLIRKARMEGKEACWIPGTDHASIATEAKVVAMLKERGIKKKDISREEFLQYAWEWKEKYGGIILEQLKKLGASCDWDRTRFTMEDHMSESVIKVFVDFYSKGYIYRGYRMINWDPQGKTALADDEVIHKDVNSKLYYVKYQIEGEDQFVTIATTRPETILGDTAVCINPEDERYRHLKGKRVIVPLVNRPVPVIEDAYVSMEFGTGCLKVTPAHDPNDYELGIKHKLETLDVMNDDGTMSEAAQFFVGEDRFVVRKKIAKEIDQLGQLEKVEDYKNSVGFSERTDAVIEPRLSEQWFVAMKELTKPALEHVLNDDVQLFPPKFKNMYRSWMENVRDWCISRQLWWGQRIPAFYLPNGEFVVAETPEAALKLAQEKSGNSSLTLDDLRQDEDVLDTWFSSGLWPISVFDGIRNPDNEDINYYYPTNDLVTAPEILFFWVARMIMYGYEYRQEKPFRNVYLTGIVRDGLGRKMSKSLGNSPDPLELIKDYGADGVRTGMLFSSPAGNDLLFDIKLCEQGRNFANKIWNAFRLVKGWEVEGERPSEQNRTAIAWFEASYNQALIELEDHFSKFRISDALRLLYKLMWDDFCSWYLEMIKPEEKKIDQMTYEATIRFFENMMRILHPFMPFLTEEIWHEIKERDEKDYLIVAVWPVADGSAEREKTDKALLSSGQVAIDIITNLRNVRNSRGIANKQALELSVRTDSQDTFRQFGGIIKKIANIENIHFIDDKIEGAASFMVNTPQGKPDECFVPLGEAVDMEQEKKRIEKELEYNRGFLAAVNKKLSNERFVQNAKEEVVAMERKKQADAEAKIQALEEQLAALNS
ncbi:valine--tRNA ligase [Catalinimonas niigatensis]|uniref:valine--tRNA ligase n=1 Tax=Catalinimonas niigatensis TaxID=1397264 RepID=UPI00266624C4|nr:valine--tRNA ligase [Catalinimonas niigatensis]WPP49027.1 valine--tRNA ligase [Catalinimonas niigatensis]